MNIAEIAGLITSVGSLIGAFVLWRKSRSEVVKNNTDSFAQEVSTIRETYSKMLEDQITSIVTPMKKRIDELEKKINELDSQVEKLKHYRGLFEASVGYIRELCHWIDSIVTTNATTPKPKLPKELRSYFNEKKGE